MTPNTEMEIEMLYALLALMLGLLCPRSWIQTSNGLWIRPVAVWLAYELYDALKSSATPTPPVEAATPAAAVTSAGEAGTGGQ